MDFHLYNILTCSGFGEGTSMGIVGVAPGECMGARLAMVGLFFIVALIRKWGGEEMNIDFNFIWSCIVGLISYLIMITLFGSIKIAFAIGLGLAVLTGYGLGCIIGGDSTE